MIDRLVRLLYWPALLLGWADVVIVATSVFHTQEAVAHVALFSSAGLAAILFCLLLLDRDAGRAMWTANYLMRQKPRGFFGGPRLWDPEWGFLGSVWHDRRMMWCNRVLFAELLLGMALTGNNERPLLIAIAGFSVTGLICPLQLKLVVDPNGPKPSTIF